VNTSWAAPNQAFESTLHALIDAVFSREPLRVSLARFAANLASKGRVNGLVQTVIKLTAPGVPDLYQGTELWDLSLVDPDNRRPVDFVRLRSLLDAGTEAWRRDPAGTVRALLNTSESGAIKQLVIAVLLAHRREHPDLFERGHYRPLPTTPAPSAPLGAYERAVDERGLCVVFRLHGDTTPGTLRLPAGDWTNLMTRTPVADAQDFDAAAGGLPFVVLTRNAAASRGARHA
jgi:(1->4)-alpha-D-glucan 1-alpha-D-glucosylmutase